MIETELAYLAGIIDGEGTLGVSKHKKERGHHYPYLTIANTSFALIQLVHKLIGEGSVYEYKSRQPKWKASYEFALRGNGLRRFLPLIQEFLFLKRRQAELVSEMLRLTNRKDPTYVYKDPKRLERREEIIEELHALNLKGKEINKEE